MMRSILGRGRLTRALALWLILLAASPLTTPFSTFDLIPLGSAAPALDSAKTKTSSDDAIGVQVFAIATPRPNVHRTLLPGGSTPHDVCGARHTVLRL